MAAFPGQDLEAQLEELSVLESIYADELEVLSRASPIAFQVRVTDRLSLRADFPSNYPSEEPPVLQLSGWVPETLAASSCAEFARIHADACGEGVVFSCVEWLRSLDLVDSSGDAALAEAMAAAQVADAAEAAAFAEAAAMAEAVEAPAAAAAASGAFPDAFARSGAGSGAAGSSDSPVVVTACNSSCPTIVHGEPIIDRKSTFIAHLARVDTPADVAAVLRRLLENRKIARASHNIMAYRIFDEDRQMMLQDNDDDGESAAGGRLAHILDIMDVRGAVVVVSRWYGGIHLGPDRFKHINNAARILLEAHGLSSRKSGGGGGGGSSRNSKKGSGSSSSSSSSSSGKSKGTASRKTKSKR
eukprot:g2071.t1